MQLISFPKISNLVLGRTQVVSGERLSISQGIVWNPYLGSHVLFLFVCVCFVVPFISQGFLFFLLIFKIVCYMYSRDCYIYVLTLTVVHRLTRNIVHQFT